MELGAVSARPASFGGKMNGGPAQVESGCAVTAPFWARSVIISGSDKINQHVLWVPRQHLTPHPQGTRSVDTIRLFFLLLTILRVQNLLPAWMHGAESAGCQISSRLRK